MIRRQFVQYCAVCLLALVSAAPLSAFAGGVNNVNVVLISVYMAASGTGALVKFSPASPSGLSGCTYTTGDMVWIDFTATGAPNGRDLYATVLAASMSGRQIGVGTTGCTSDGYFPVAYGINVWP